MAASVAYSTVNGMLMMENREGVKTAYTPDTLGNLIQCRDASGTKTYEAWYWSYGEVRSSTGANPSPWGFVGLLGYYTDALNFLYVRARFYRPNLTRWQTVDPLWPRLRAYRYCGNSPINKFDPSGKQVGVAVMGAGICTLDPVLIIIGGLIVIAVVVKCACSVDWNPYENFDAGDYPYPPELEEQCESLAEVRCKSWGDVSINFWFECIEDTIKLCLESGGIEPGEGSEWKPREPIPLPPSPPNQWPNPPGNNNGPFQE